MTRPKSPNRSSRRTSIITAASIGAVGVAGLFAIGANLGILSTTNQNAVGQVSAVGDLIPIDAQLADPTSTAGTGAGSQHFTVDEAGSVDVSVGTDGPRLDLVTPADGWTAAQVTAAGADLAIAFTNGARTFEFTAVVGPDGTVVGDVTEPSVAAAPQPADDHVSDDHHDDDHKSDDHKSDDHHHYEGGDDDD